VKWELVKYTFLAAALALLALNLYRDRMDRGKGVVITRRCDLIIENHGDNLCFDRTDGKGHHVEFTKSEMDAVQAVFDQKPCGGEYGVKTGAQP
jgi:hypothetical protein